MSVADISVAGMSVSVITGYDRPHAAMGARQPGPARGGRARPVRRARVREHHRCGDRRAGRVTKRTFFRHFADKREVLFGGAGRSASTLRAGHRRRTKVGGTDRRRRRGPRRRRSNVQGPSRLRTAAPGRHRRERRPAGARAGSSSRHLLGAGRGVAPTRREEPAASLTAEAGIAGLQGCVRALGHRQQAPRPRAAHAHLPRRAEGRDLRRVTTTGGGTARFRFGTQS